MQSSRRMPSDKIMLKCSCAMKPASNFGGRSFSTPVGSCVLISLMPFFSFPKPTLRYALRIMPSRLDFTVIPTAGNAVLHHGACNSSNIPLRPTLRHTRTRPQQRAPHTSWNAVPTCVDHRSRTSKCGVDNNISLSPCLLSPLSWWAPPHVCSGC